MQGEGAGLPPGWRREALDEVSSTNAVALERARAGDRGGLWITANRQSAGRGRRGRPWVSEPGNLYASLLLVDPAKPADCANLPLVAALGVYGALKPYFARTPQALAIKWPNDVLVDGAKINGILLESETLPDGRVAVVIGCGINCAHHPESAAYPATDLKACGFEVTPEALFPDLARAMYDVLVLWDRGAGFGAVREEWLRAAHGVGGPVRVNLADRVLEGRFADLDPQGYLLVEDSGKTLHRISAGDLFFTS